jgi:hypothetical protein
MNLVDTPAALECSESRYTPSREVRKLDVASRTTSAILDYIDLRIGAGVFPLI